MENHKDKLTIVVGEFEKKELPELISKFFHTALKTSYSIQENFLPLWKWLLK